MKIKDMIQEGLTNTPLISVDVQPAYAPYIDFSIPSYINFLNQRTGSTLIFCNAEETGMTNESIGMIQEWYLDNGLLEEKVNEFQWYDKGYGYLRSWMDMEVPPAFIIKTIREMYQQKVSDSQSLFGGDEEKLQQYYSVLNDEDRQVCLEDQISVDWVSIGLLRQYNNGFICGGGDEECLREITLLMNAFNIKYKLLKSFIY